jgi:hypothetical protein
VTAVQAAGLDYEAAKPIIGQITIAAFVVCITFTVGGFVLIYFGSSTNTNISLLGAKLSTGSVGLVCLFFASVMFIVLTRTILQAVVNTLRIPERPRRPNIEKHPEGETAPNHLKLN